MRDFCWYAYDPNYQLYFSIKDGEIFRSEFDEAIPFQTYENVLEVQQDFPELEVFYNAPHPFEHTK